MNHGIVAFYKSPVTGRRSHCEQKSSCDTAHVEVALNDSSVSMLLSSKLDSLLLSNQERAAICTSSISTLSIWYFRDFAGPQPSAQPCPSGSGVSHLYFSLRPVWIIPNTRNPDQMLAKSQ